MIPSLVAVTKSVEAGHEAANPGAVDPQDLERRGSPRKCKQETSKRDVGCRASIVVLVLPQ